MKSSEFKLRTIEEQDVQVYEWLPDDVSKIKGVVQIAHGMAEHGKRYASLAEYLTENGYAVYANDHRGHGKTAGEIEKLGFWDKVNGWNKVIADMRILSVFIREKRPSKPIFVMGHSMGSFLVRKYILAPPFKLSGAILSGTSGNPGIMGRVGVILTNILMLFKAKNSPSKLMDKLSFGAYNSNFKPNRTAFDWLSRDNEQVDKYIEDPYCGTIFSLKFFNDMINGLLYVSRQAVINKTAEDLAIYLFSGDKDPVGNNGKGVKEVYDKFKKTGVKDVSMKLYPEGRHEMCNEINHKDVFSDIVEWLNNQLS